MKTVKNKRGIAPDAPIYPKLLCAEESTPAITDGEGKLIRPKQEIFSVQTKLRVKHEDGTYYLLHFYQEGYTLLGDTPQAETQEIIQRLIWEVYLFQNMGIVDTTIIFPETFISPRRNAFELDKNQQPEIERLKNILDR